MSVRGIINKGDWIKATFDNGASLVGQATRNCRLGGDANLLIKLDSISSVTINVNFAEVTILYRNLIDS